MAEFAPTDDFGKAVDRAARATTDLGWCVICGWEIVGRADHRSPDHAGR